MGGRPVREVPCKICGKPIDLRADPADENGKAVHEDCYLKRITNQRGNSDALFAA
jgi:hypothetical protein